MGLQLDIEWIKFWLLILAFVGSGGVAVARVMIGINNLSKEIKADYMARLDAMENSHTIKRDRVYQRLDEYKNFIEDNYMRKDMCLERRTNTDQILCRLEKKLESIEQILMKVHNA
jgi:hypothetical protein